MYTITLSDGRTLENVELNGNNYIAQTEVPDDFFESGMDTVTFSGGDLPEIIVDCVLLSNIVRDGRSWLVFGAKSAEQKEKEALQAQIASLSAKLLEYATRN